MAAVDFAAFGAVEIRPLSRMQGLTAAVSARNWAMIPHVTHHDDADITALEALRATRSSPGRAPLLPFFAKALVPALQAFPQFNASLDAAGGNLVLKKYFHIGIAIDTPRGLWSAWCATATARRGAHRGRHRRAVRQGAWPRAAAERDGGRLHLDQLAGRHRRHGFTPIVNAPEVAILGVCQARSGSRSRGAEARSNGG